MRIKRELLERALENGYILSFVNRKDHEQIIASQIGVEYCKFGRIEMKKSDIVFSKKIEIIQCKAIVFPMRKVMRVEF